MCLDWNLEVIIALYADVTQCNFSSPLQLEYDFFLNSKDGRRIWIYRLPKTSQFIFQTTEPIASFAKND